MYSHRRLEDSRLLAFERIGSTELQIIGLSVATSTIKLGRARLARRTARLIPITFKQGETLSPGPLLAPPHGDGASAILSEADRPVLEA
jgi:hypothetical protein